MPANELILLLSLEQQIVFKRPRQHCKALKECIDRNYVSVHFPKTGTEVGFKLFLPQCDLLSGNFETEEGAVTLSGGLILDFIKVKCTVQLDLATCTGGGYLTAIEEKEYSMIMGEAEGELNMV
ncbi:hypothetical protein FNH22_20895 [Fulvivirga sp. M361]|uniref:hypothetical protein n=1 Tax=Fulvivirga sp. M361 TaxID=2594266 RepID=UPI001179BBE0|nr:hypothetical protein [Fulvivirga sp. M361]TRX53356.1 hypothetical protein FNH22_20895 [Fulvivirga sp. M361]